MPISSHTERPDLFDYQDCRPGPSAYPPKDEAELRKKAGEIVAAIRKKRAEAQTETETETQPDTAAD